MEFYKTCRTLSIYAFNEILKANDLRFLIKGYDEYSEKEIKLFGDDLIEANEIFKDIVYEYSELTFNRSVLQNYVSQINIEKEEFRYSVTEKILNFYSESEDLNVLAMLNKLDWNLDIEADINKQIENIVASMKRFKTKINVLKLKYQDKFKSKKIKSIFAKYSDLEAIDKRTLSTISGIAVAIFNEAGFLEIGLYKSNPKVATAASMLGITYRDAITINFN